MLIDSRLFPDSLLSRQDPYYPFGKPSRQRDPDFAVNLKKFIGVEPDPLFPEEQAKVISEIPRDPQAIEIYRKIIGGGPLPPR